MERNKSPELMFADYVIIVGRTEVDLQHDMNILNRRILSADYMVIVGRTEEDLSIMRIY